MNRASSTPQVKLDVVHGNLLDQADADVLVNATPVPLAACAQGLTPRTATLPRGREASPGTSLPANLDAAVEKMITVCDVKPKSRAVRLAVIQQACAVKKVSTRPQWLVLLAVLFASAVFSASAAFASAVVTLLTVLTLILLACRVLNLDPFNPFSVIRSLRLTGGKELLVAGLLIAAVLAVGNVMAQLPTFTAWLAQRTNGDANLFIALIYSAVAAFACLVIGRLQRYHPERLRIAATSAANGPRFTSPPPNDEGARVRYWRSATEALILTTIALIPAALLSNWAWNVIASAALPLFYLSVKEQMAATSR